MEILYQSESQTRKRKRKSRGRGLRKTTGCTICRKRHVRCDEGKPVCGQCLKGAHDCSYLEDLVKNSMDSQAALDARPSSATQNAGPAEPSPRYSDRPLQNVSQTGKYGSLTSPDVLQEDYQSAMGQPTANLRTSFSQGSEAVLLGASPSSEIADSFTGLPADAASSRWFGLLAADAADRYSNLQNFNGDFAFHPLSDGRSGESQNVSHARTVQHSQVPISDESQVTASLHDINNTCSNSLSNLPAEKTVPGRHAWQTSNLPAMSPYECLLFSNFVTHVSQLIDLFDPLKHFSILVPHLAVSPKLLPFAELALPERICFEALDNLYADRLKVHDAGLMNAILALSARYLSLHSYSPNDQPHDRNSGLRYYYETLHCLQKFMQYDSYACSLELLATALIVSTYEMLDDFGNGWERHLKGVFWIQRSQVIHGESGGLRQAIWWAWLRQDIWAALRERRKTFSFWHPTKMYSELNCYELSCRSVYLFARAVDYCSSEEVNAGITDLQSRIDRADTVLQMLDEWYRSLTPEFMPLPADRNREITIFQPLWIHPPGFGVAVQLYHSARLLILLNRPTFGGLQEYSKQQSQIASSVDTICGIAMSLNDEASNIMSSQCLFLAGASVQDLSRREVILTLIDKCQSQTGWPTRSLSEELCLKWKSLDKS